MSTFIEELDNMFAIAKTSEDSHAFDANYGIFIPIRVHIYGTINTNFIICKREFTKYLYIKGGCRVYFTDVDILTMLLSVKEQNTIRRFIDELKNLYKSNGVGQKYEIEFAGQSYEVNGLRDIEEIQVIYQKCSRMESGWYFSQMTN